ncbi:MAG: dCTP deaminase [Defluviitaleaceae bacterium]|nr:dCTP deaminase [Defluviitaleaceae bacterium]
MILSGIEIEKHIGNEINIEPFCKTRLNPNSYNLRLHNELLVYDELVLDMKKKHKLKIITIPDTGLELKPGILYLGRTMEYTKTDKFIPMLEGRSSIGRLGIYIHVTAGFGDVGFEGFWTLELQCVQPVIIYPYIEVCQIYYHTILGNYEKYEKGKYQKNTGIQPSMLYKDFDNNVISAFAPQK